MADVAEELPMDSLGPAQSLTEEDAEAEDPSTQQGNPNTTDGISGGADALGGAADSGNAATLDGRNSRRTSQQNLLSNADGQQQQQQQQQQLQEPKKPAVTSKDYFRRPEAALPVETELAGARNFLLQNSGNADTNLYDHLSAVLMRVLEQRPNDAVDVFENLSADVKRVRFQPDRFDLGTRFKNAQDQDKAVALANAQAPLLAGPRNDEKAEPSSTESGEIPDIMELANLFEWAGISFGKEDTFLLLLALRKLVEDKDLKSVRLWGKILGTKTDYYVIEAESKDGVRDESQLETTNAGNKSADDEDGEGNGNGREEGTEDGDGADSARPPASKANAEVGSEDEDGNVENWFEPGTAVPKPKQKLNPSVAVEVGNGINKYIYYVCSYPGGPWQCLPDVIPEKIQTARKVRKLFTGNLTTKIVSYPPFDGSEAQYLRCQIARISAATVISPSGYYAFDNEDEEADEAEGNGTIIVNPEFEGHPNDALMQLSNWVHHVPYILPQGRVSWVNPFEGLGRGGEDGEDNEDENGSEDGDETNGATGGDSGEGAGEPETGPPILSSIGVDNEHGDSPAWTVRLCSSLGPLKYSPVTLRSMAWPGATTVSYMDKFANIYVGNGLKDLAGKPFTSAQLPEIQREFASVEGSSDVTEIVDPTVEEETAFEEARAKAEEDDEDKEDGSDGEDGEDGEGGDGEDD